MKKYIVLLLMLVSCGKKSALIFKTNDAITALPLGQAATFENIKSAILTPHCLRCHANVTTAESSTSGSCQVTLRPVSSLKKWKMVRCR
jgi:cytochrome c553